jgi:hypothetical protein
MRSAGGVLSQLVFAMTTFALNMLFISLAGLVRLLPLLLPTVGRLAWGLLLLSCRVYYLLLTRVAPILKARLRVDLLNGLWRLAATVSLSLALGLLFLFSAQWPLMIWTVGPFAVHGLFVDYIWDDIPETANLLMGMRL